MSSAAVSPKRFTPLATALSSPLVATDLTPGQRSNPRELPFDDFIQNSMALLTSNPSAAEVCVERVKLQRTVEASGQYDAVFNRINPVQ